jgi:hypothetical protein
VHSSDQRLAPRFAWDGEITILGELARLVDISASGVCFETTHRFIEGAAVSILLPFSARQQRQLQGCL